MIKLFICLNIVVKCESQVLEHKIYYSEYIKVYQGNATNRKHSPPEAPKEEDLRNTEWQNKYNILSHQRTNNEELQLRELHWNDQKKTYWGPKPDLLDRNSALNSIAALNYKHTIYRPTKIITLSQAFVIFIFS